jgi:hypothetical protein
MEYEIIIKAKINAETIDDAVDGASILLKDNGYSGKISATDKDGNELKGDF